MIEFFASCHARILYHEFSFLGKELQVTKGYSLLYYSLMSSNSYIITAFTSPEINQEFEQMKKKFGSFLEESEQPELVTLKNIAHLTLKYPFSYQQPEEELTRRLESFTFSPIPLRVTEYQLFETKKHGMVLVVLPDQSTQLQNLHEQIVDILDEKSVAEHEQPFERQLFNPHLSLLYNVSEEQKRDALTYVEKQILPFEFAINTFSLFKQSSEQPQFRIHVRDFHAG